MTTEADAVRVDAWIWAVRLARTRSAATALCKAGHVKVNDIRAKPAQPVRVGDEVRVLTEGGQRVVAVRRLIVKRVGATLAADAYEDRTPPPPTREERIRVAWREPGSGRPTKRDRREIDRLRGSAR